MVYLQKDLSRCVHIVLVIHRNGQNFLYIFIQEEALANEKKKLAEDRLAILENQMRIDKEKQKEKKKQEKKVKQEQMKILGKDKSTPKLSFSLNKN